MVSVEVVVRWFINNVKPDPLKLQKLLYFSQGISFCMFDEKLFDDDFEAWVHGPVIPKIYHQYKMFGYNPIDIQFELPQIDLKVLEVLEYVKKNYAKYDGKFLENIIHNQEFVFDKMNNNNILKEAIAEYFTTLMYQPVSSEWS